jgi:hypothetical protein
MGGEAKDDAKSDHRQDDQFVGQLRDCGDDSSKKDHTNPPEQDVSACMGIIAYHPGEEVAGDAEGCKYGDDESRCDSKDRAEA